MTDTPDLAGLETAEDRLQAVVAAGDADGLALLLHDDLLATSHLGTFVSKEDDLAGYRSGAFQVSSYTELRRRTLFDGGTGVTAVRAAITGSMQGEPFDVVMDYTRTWVHTDGRWQVLAAHLSPAPIDPEL